MSKAGGGRAANERPEEIRRRRAAQPVGEADPRQQSLTEAIDRAEEIVRLETKRDELVERLDKGSIRIEDARDQGKDVSEWEDYWLSLLRQYEGICARLLEEFSGGKADEIQS